MAVDLKASVSHLWGIATRLKWIPISGEAMQQRDIDTCWMRDHLFSAYDEIESLRSEITGLRAELARGPKVLIPPRSCLLATLSDLSTLLEYDKPGMPETMGQFYSWLQHISDCVEPEEVAHDSKG